MDLGEVEKIWEEWEEGNNNQNLLYEKDLFSIKRKNCVVWPFHYADIKCIPVKCSVVDTFSNTNHKKL